MVFLIYAFAGTFPFEHFGFFNFLVSDSEQANRFIHTTQKLSDTSTTPDHFLLTSIIMFQNLTILHIFPVCKN